MKPMKIIDAEGLKEEISVIESEVKVLTSGLL